VVIVAPDPDLNQRTDHAVKTMLQLHRGSLGNDGLIVFAARDPELGWDEGVAGIPADRVASMFPEFAEELFSAAELFHTINTFEPQEPRGGRFKGARGNNRVRYLTAAFADFDCYTMGVSQDQAIGAAIKAQDEGKIPPVSIYGRSGEGIWLFWLLRGEGGEGPIRADRDTSTEYRNLQTQLHETLSQTLPDLGLDGGASDTSRYCRVGGSTHPSGAIVEYLFGTGGDMRPRVYTIAELRDLLLPLPAADPRTPYDPPKRVEPRAKATGQKAKIPGLLTRPALIAGEIHQLARARNGFKEGTRDWAIWYLAWALTNSGASPQEVWDQCLELGMQWCKPSLAGYDIKWAVRDAERRRDPRFGPSNHTIAKNLQVTSEEVEALSLHHVDPNFVRDRYRGAPRKSRAEERRQQIPDLVERLEEENQKWGIRDLLIALQGEGWGGENGGDLSPQTVWKDLGELGIETPQQRRNRERKEAEYRQRNILT